MFTIPDCANDSTNSRSRLSYTLDGVSSRLLEVKGCPERPRTTQPLSLDEHVAHNRLPDPSLDTRKLILPVDDTRHFVFAADRKRNLRSVPNLFSRGVVCYCRFDESLRCCPKCQ